MLLTLLKHDEIKLSASKKQNMSDYALARIKAAIELNELNPLNYMNKAKLLQLIANSSNELDQIDQNYRRGLQLNPYKLGNRSAFAQFLVSQNKEEQAFLIMQQAMDKGYFESPAK